jgi:hypothetical protein
MASRETTTDSAASPLNVPDHRGAGKKEGAMERDMKEGGKAEGRYRVQRCALDTRLTYSQTRHELSRWS